MEGFPAGHGFFRGRAAENGEKQMRRVLLFVLWLVFFGVPTGVFGGEEDDRVFRFTLTPWAEPGLPAPEAIGRLALRDGVTVPAFVLPVDDAAEDGLIRRKPERMSLDAAVRPRFAARLAAYYTGHWGREGWLLAPAAWRLMRAQAGMNGSAVFVFAPPRGETGFLSFQSTGACAGCAAMEASLYFPDIRARVEEEYGMAYTSSEPPLDSIVDIRPHTRAWRVVLGGRNIDGITFYDGDSDDPFFTWSVSLPDPDGDLATPVLNWLLPPKKQP